MIGSMNSSVLLLCCCSNRKLAGGDHSYTREDSLAKAIGDRGRDLIGARKRVLERIRTGARSIQGTALCDLPYNRQLVDGRDLGGTASGLYMPAMRRYRGRFFQELDPDETGSFNGDSHRLLVVSALYGLVAPNEPIQRYSCHTLDDDEIARTWGGGLLTSLLLLYVRNFEVRLIIDLLADASYRQLFNWERIRKSGVRVLRAYGEQNTGPALLPGLGFLARETLASQSAEDLLGIDVARTFITDYEDVVLTSETVPPAPFLGEAPRPAAGRGPAAQMVSRTPSRRIVVEDATECIVLAQPREIRVTSGGHGTIFGRQVTRIRDVPPDARRLLETVSRAAEVLEVRLGPFVTAGASRKFALVVMPPRQGGGTIEGKLTGQGKIGGSQQLRIRVTPGREAATYLALVRLLSNEVA